MAILAWKYDVAVKQPTAENDFVVTTNFIIHLEAHKSENI